MGKQVACNLQVGGEFLPQVEVYKYLGVLFTSEHLTYGHELWVMPERTRSWIQVAEMSFLRRVAGRSLRDKELCHPGGAWSRAAAPPHREGPVEVAWASVSDDSWTSPWGGVLGMPHWEETPGKTQDTLERLPEDSVTRDSLSAVTFLTSEVQRPPGGLVAGSRALIAAAQKGEPSSLTLSEEGRGHLVYEIPVSDSGSAGLGLSLKGNKSRETGEDLGIFIKSIIHGGAAFKASHISLLTYDQIERKIDRDGRLRVNDQLVAVNGESLLGRSNNDAMETLRRSMSMEGNHRETIQLVILRALENSPTQERRQDGGQSRENPPAQYNHNDASNGVAQPPMVINSIYAHAPGPVSASNGRPGVYYDASDEDDFASHPSDMESDFNPQPKYAQNRAEREPASNPTYQLQHTQRHPKTSMSMDLVADEGNIGGKQPRRPAPKMSSLGPTLGLQKSSSLESLQTAMEEASKSSVPFHRPAGPMVRGRGCNMSFRQAIDKSYDGPSEPEDDYSEDSSGRETPASGSSRQELEDGGKDKKKKTKKKKEKKTKTKKKDDADDPDKKTKKKGFVLLRDIVMLEQVSEGKM
ncbi:hypothetical protein QTP70_013701 [Hemibagrus guttatus]|uniref:PDZ domain-containing protein n=1 Tax=Hemibagrus guttatus TaxID=175788 RepID=A0AAE0PZ92_9TELE|nr:hypothetical protein QTP70_013701 [Hemibagrus guttatus]